MGSPHISNFRFLDLAGDEMAGPREWRRSLIEVLLPPSELERIRLIRHGEALQPYVRHLNGAPRLLADWPLSGAGGYRLTLEYGDERQEIEVSVDPEKISPAAYAQLVTELQTKLPASVAVALQQAGALAGLELRPPGETTLAQELARLRIAVLGTDTAAGLASTLHAIARDPHRVLRKREEWVPRERVRRLEPVGLLAALRQPNNVDPESRLPRRAPDVRVEHSFDVYENRLLRSFHDEVRARLRRVAAALDAHGTYVPLLEAESLLEQLRRARLAADFLDDVGELDHLPNQVSMVLLKRAEYRSLLEAYLRFHRSAYIQLDAPGLEAPLENLPGLYELWGTLHVILTLLRGAAAHGYEVTEQRLARHVDGGVYLKVLGGGEPAVVLRHRVTGTSVRLTPQSSFGSTPTRGLRSISFVQIPDIAVDIRRPGERPRVYLFDPKYKLRSEENAEIGDGKPKKEDIDTMHAYRDAIRTLSDERVVEYAAILYPGPETRYGDGIEALSARPLDLESFQTRLADVLAEALGG